MPRFRNPIVGNDVLLIPAIQSSKQNLDGSGPAWSISTDGNVVLHSASFNQLSGTTIDGFSSSVDAFTGLFNQLKVGLPNVSVRQTVSAGAADSGGAGFRVLRVPN